jgi:hypothetical protein
VDSRFSAVSTLADNKVAVADTANENVVVVPAWARCDAGSPFVFDPTSGALILRPDYRGKPAKAIARERRRLALALYVRQRGPQLAYLRFNIEFFSAQCCRLVLQAFRYLTGVTKEVG